MEPWYRKPGAVAAAVAEHGSVKNAAAATGVPKSTLQKWRNPTRWADYYRRYDAGEKGVAKKKRENAKRRQRARRLGLCANCQCREPEFGTARCVRCARYKTEHQWLGYSTIPLAKGADG